MSPKGIPTGKIPTIDDVASKAHQSYATGKISLQKAIFNAIAEHPEVAKATKKGDPYEKVFGKVCLLIDESKKRRPNPRSGKQIRFKF